MKTITEISALQLTKVCERIQALTTEGKTPEEMHTTIGEEFKLEGDKLKYTLGVADVLKDKISDLKRVVIVTPEEGKEPSNKAQQKDDFYFVSEFFPRPTQKRPARGEEKGRDRKGGRDGKNKKGKKRFSKDRRPRDEKSTTGENGGERKFTRKPRPPRKPRPERPTVQPKLGPDGNPLPPITWSGSKLHQKETSAPSTPTAE